jgi:molybdopterin-binding protein
MSEDSIKGIIFMYHPNVFSVEYENTAALTGDLEIETGKECAENHGYIAIRPKDIVLSRSPFASSMRNSFQGKVESVSDKGFFYEVGVRVGKVFSTSLITKKSPYELRVHEGTEVYLAFKATAIHSF